MYGVCGRVPTGSSTVWVGGDFFLCGFIAVVVLGE